MSYQCDLQPKLSYHSINPGKQIAANYILRKILSLIDSDFIYSEHIVTDLSPREVNEVHSVSTLLSVDQSKTKVTAHTAVADTTYGTVDNYTACYCSRAGALISI